MQDKKVLIRLHTFLCILILHKTKYKPGQKTAYTLVTMNKIGKTFLCQQ